MTPTDKLHQMICDFGYTIANWIPARGYWTHRHQDVARWQCYVWRKDQHFITDQKTEIICWHTVKECVKCGIKLIETGPFSLECVPK